MQWKIPVVDTYFQHILERSPDGFELDHLQYALKYVKNFRVAVDGGAHIGTWAVALAKRFNNVFAFEPAPDTFRCLVENVLNIPNVSAVPAALGSGKERYGRANIIDDPTRPGNTGARIICPGDTIFVDPLDGHGFEDVDFIKLDLEGYELEALKGAVRTIAEYQPTIMMECKKFNPSRYGGPEAATSFLKKLGYKEVGGIRNDRVFVHV